MHDDNIRVYTPGRNAGWGLGIWREMAVESWRSRELIWRLFLREFSARYRQTALGVSWALLMPIVVIGIFIVLNRSGVFSTGAMEVPYPVFGVLGLAIWQIFAGGLVSCSNSIVSGGNIIVKINFPKETMVLAAFGQALVDFLIRLVLVALIFVYYRFVPPWQALFLPLALIPLILFSLGLGLLLALANVLLRDIAYIVSLLTTFLLFLTPVLYREPAGPAALLARYNPLATLVGEARDLVLRGEIREPGVYLAMCGISLLIFLVSWRAFHLAEARMAERIGAR